MASVLTTTMMITMTISLVGGASPTSHSSNDGNKYNSSLSSNYNDDYPQSSHESRDMSEISMSTKYEQWVAKYGREYKDDIEKDMRFKIFKQNIEHIESFNRDGCHSYKLGVNKYTDLTSDEFRATRNVFHPKALKRLNNNGPNNKTTLTNSIKNSKLDLPDSIDWRDQGAVSPVEDQGSCDSSWAFTTVDAIEAIVMITTGNMNSLSVQELLDCDEDSENDGCSGGNHSYAFDFVINNLGLTSKDSYPYDGMEGACNIDVALIETILGVVDVLMGEQSLMEAVAQQPVAVSVDSSDPDFKNYVSGVYDGPCGTNLDHSMTVVGYGTDPDQGKFWTLKNSFGEGWGEGGYMRMKRDVGTNEGKCGVAMEAVVPTN